MDSVLIAAVSFVGFLVAYHTYGRYLARKIFKLNPEAPTPAHTMADGVDYVPARRAVLFVRTHLKGERAEVLIPGMK